MLLKETFKPSTQVEEYSILQDWEYREESWGEFNKRYSGFGKDLYINIKERFPEIFEKLKYYQSVEFQTEDSFATYSDGITTFGIQLDPLIEVIVLWNKENHLEITSYTDNEYEVAMNFIKKKFLQ